MPIEIRELTIKINLSDEGSGSGGASSGGGADPDAQQALVEAIADKVLTILREKQER